MLITLYAPLPVKVRKENSSNVALAICMINNNLNDGNFNFDINEGAVFFKMTSSFFETDVNSEIFEYMLSAAADTVEDYYSRVSLIARSEQQFIEAEESDFDNSKKYPENIQQSNSDSHTSKDGEINSREKL